MINNKSNQPFLVENKEKKEVKAKNKNSVKIIIKKNISNEERSKSQGTYLSPKISNKPIMKTDSNKNRKNVFYIKDKLISNSSLNKNIQNCNNIKEQKIDLNSPMTFTFNFKEKKLKH